VNVFGWFIQFVDVEVLYCGAGVVEVFCWAIQFMLAGDQGGNDGAEGLV